MNSRLDDLKKIASSRADDPRAHFELGCAAQASGELVLAANCFAKVTQLAETVAVGHFNLGTVCFSLKCFPEAVRAFSRAFELNPDRGTLNNLGNAFAAMGDFGLAIEKYEQALTWPDDGTGSYVVLKNLGTARQADGDRRGAVDALMQALDEPESSRQIFSQLVRLWADIDCKRAKQWLLTRPAEVDQSPELLALQADCLTAEQALEPALQNLMRASDLAPDHPLVLASLGRHYFQRGRHFEALACLHRALSGGAPDLRTHSAWLYCQLFQNQVDMRRFSQEAQRWQTLYFEAHSQWSPETAQHEPLRPEAAKVQTRSGKDAVWHLGVVTGPDALRRLRLFIQPLLIHAAHLNVRVSLYCDCDESQLADWLPPESPHVHWTCTRYLGDSRLKRAIESDGVDALIDLTGHAAGSRLGVFARRSAPLQICWAGWMATTGIGAMDLLIADDTTSGHEASELFSESVLRLSGCMFCCMPPELDEHSPEFAHRRPTFGAICGPIKLSEKLITTWCKLLRQTPDARLKLADTTYCDASLRQEILEKFRLREIEAEQIELSRIEPDGVEEMRQFLSSLQVLLDPFPWNAPEITCEALLMGIPVVALRGDRASSRTSASILQAAGLGSWVAESSESYFLLATEIVQQQRSRRELQIQVAASKLCDTPAWTRNFISALKERSLAFLPHRNLNNQTCDRAR